jgi:predicted aspartyl protease
LKVRVTELDCHGLRSWKSRDMGVPIIDVFVNGDKLKALVSTATTQSVITARAAAELKLDLTDCERRGNALTVKQMALMCRIQVQNHVQ